VYIHLLSHSGFRTIRAVRLKNRLAQPLTELDVQLLQSLTKNSRTSINKISENIGVSADTVQKHIIKMEETGILKGYTAVVDLIKMGYPVTAVVFMQLEGGYLPQVESEIAKEDNVLAVYDMTGDYDAAIIAKFKDNGGLNAFVKRLLVVQHVRRTVTNVAFNVIKENFNSPLLSDSKLVKLNVEEESKRA